MSYDTMDDRKLSSFHKPSFPSTHLLDEVSPFPEKEVGCWKSEFLPDHYARLFSNGIMLGQSMEATKSNSGVEEPPQTLEEMEAQMIGNLLPDDDDLFSGAIHDFARVAQYKKDEDVDDNLFYSEGGMELEADAKLNYKQFSDCRNSGAFGGQNKVRVGELPRSDHPTRNLLVRNIDDSVLDMDIRGLFEQYGDIQALYTDWKHHGFVIISYFDIRAAENAARALENVLFGCHRLEICFFSSKDYPLENNISQGILVIFNLDSSVSKDSIHRIFGAYGEIKEIYEISDDPQQKIIEFYDVRSSDVARHALNKREIAGKRIEIEAYSPGGPSLMQQFPVEPKEKEPCRQGAHHHKSPFESSVSLGLMNLGANTSKDCHLGATQGIHSATQMPTTSFMETNFQGISSILPHNLSSTFGFTTMGNHSKSSVLSDLSYSLGSMNLGLENMPRFQPHSHANFHDSVMGSIPFSTADDLRIRNTNGLDYVDVHSRSYDHNDVAFGTSANGNCSLHEHQYGWNNSSTYSPHLSSSMSWHNLPSFVNSHLPQAYGIQRRLSHMPTPVGPSHHRRVSSDPAVKQSAWDQRQTYAAVCTQAASLQSGSLGGVGFSSCSPLSPLEFAPRNIFSHATGNDMDPSISSGHIGIPSPRQRGQIFRGRGSGSTTQTGYDGHSDRARSRRSDASINQGDNKKQYELDIDRIHRCEDSRTTLMIKNIPNKYTSKMLLATIDEQHKGTYDFVYLPIDFKNKCNVGYAFINMIDPQHIIPFYQAFNGKKWEKFNSEKVASLAYARIQGKAALIAHFQNSSLMNEDKRCRPIIFHSNGPNAGDQEPFPVGGNIRSRRSRIAAENQRTSLCGSSNSDESSSSGSTKDE